MVDLSGKVAVVTGAAQGIGREIALSLAENGARVIVTDVTDQVFDVVKEIEALGGEGLAIKCDVTDPAEGKDVVSEVLGKYGRVDIVVNNAGIYPARAFTEMTEEEWDRVLRINLRGTFHCTKAALPTMIKQRYGKIINISSIAGSVVGFQNLVHYFASKAGIVGFTRSLALEVAQYGININAVAPGPIETPGTKTNEIVYEQTRKAIPLNRWGLPKDVANLVVFLASDDSSFITGQCIVVDGGYTLQ
jgi:3-oxoacyl-[acyl-carrier protein] reductase